jgi:hypothetical protein
VAPAVFPFVVVTFAGFVIVFASAVASLAVLSVRGRAALAYVLVSDSGCVGLGRLGGGFCSVAVTSLACASAPVPNRATMAPSMMVLRMMVSPGLRLGRPSGLRQDALLAGTADNRLLADVSELSGGSCQWTVGGNLAQPCV